MFIFSSRISASFKNQVAGEPKERHPYEIFMILAPNAEKSLSINNTIMGNNISIAKKTPKHV
jgi:hypothetical protein